MSIAAMPGQGYSGERTHQANFVYNSSVAADATIAPRGAEAKASAPTGEESPNCAGQRCLVTPRRYKPVRWRSRRKVQQKDTAGGKRRAMSAECRAKMAAGFFALH